jgi:DNA polymerase III subunit epsilon
MKKPLVVLDIETTGLDRTKDWIIQFAAIKVDVDANKIVDTINLMIRPEKDYIMSIGAYIKHKIHPDSLKDKPTFKEVANDIYKFIDGCDILTFNGTSFDLPFLMNEFAKVGIDFKPTDYTCYDACKTENRRYSHHLVDVFKRYRGKTIEEYGLSPHDALSDVKACYAVFVGQNKVSPVEPEKMLTDDDSLVLGEFTPFGEHNGQEEVLMNFGKYRQVPLKIVKATDPGYISWLLSNTTSQKTKELLQA